MEYVYAALLLHGLGKAIDEQGMKTVIEATGTQPDETKIKSLVTSLKGLDIEKAISEAAVAAPVAAAPKAEEKKEEEKPEAAAEGLSALFG